VALEHKVSRRRTLITLSGAAGGFIIDSTLRRSFAETVTRIEQFAPELEKVISTTEPIRELASGFGNELGNTEGPVWWKEGRYLLFSDIGNNRRIKYVPGIGTSVFKEPRERTHARPSRSPRCR
jgi:hypothetical protein